MAGPTKTKVLQLDRIYDFDAVNIDGKEYPLRNRDAIALLDYRWIEKKQPRMVELFNLDDPAEEDAEELSTLVERLTRIILDAPDAVQESLSDMQRMDIISFFSRKSKPAKKKRATKKKAKRKKRG